MRHNHGLRAQSGAAWTPAAITTELWLDASDSSSITTVGGLVSQWNDKSGNLRHCYQGTDGNRPTYQTNAINGKNAVRFVSSDYLSSSLALNLTRGFDFFVVAKNVVRKNYNGLFSIRPGVGETSQFEVYWQVGSGNSGNLVTVYNRQGDFNGSQTNNAGPVVGSYYIHSVASGKPATRYLAGVAQGTSDAYGTGAGLPASANPYFVGYGYGNNGNVAAAALDGDICEIIVCPVNTSTQTRQIIEGYLAHKWGLTSSLLSSHPYKTAAPLAGSKDFNYISLLLSGDGSNGAQNNTFIDQSANNHSLTRNGNPTQGSFSPFPATGTAYSPELHGGSAFFDGSGDQLKAPSGAVSNIGTNDFTIEGWFYPKSFSQDTLYRRLWAFGSGLSNSLQFHVDDGNILAPGRLVLRFNDAIRLSSTSSIALDQWSHVAVVKSAGTTTIYINGFSAGSTATNDNLSSAGTAELCIGSGAATTNGSWHGFVSGFRVVKGSAVYTADFTPAAAPPTAITNTSLLLNFTNAGVVDATGNNVLETVGNAQISTTQKKYGTGALYFDGSGDYLATPAGSNSTIGGADFTIEFWARPANTSDGYRAMVADEQYGSGAGWSFYQYGPEIRLWITGTLLLSYSTALTANAWTHLAWTRSGTSNKLFVDGVERASSTNGMVFTGSRFLIGCNANGSLPNYLYPGYIDDLRITKGVARYTANFTPPSSALPLQ